MSDFVLKYFVRGIILKPTTEESGLTEGSIIVNGSEKKFKVYLDSALREVITADQSQTLINKTLTSPIINTATINSSELITPSRIDFKQGLRATLDTYATTADNGQAVFATDTKEYLATLDGELVELGSGGASFKATQAGHGFSLLTPIYHNGTSWVKAQANSGDKLATYVVTAIQGDRFTATKFGLVKITGHGLTVGQYYFVSTDTAGAIQSSEPIFGYSNPVLYVQDANNVHIMCYRPSVIGDGSVSDSEIGSIVAFPSLIAPVGFLFADGRAVSRTTYAELFGVIGTTFGSGDGSSTFNIPDLRGQFLRGDLNVTTITGSGSVGSNNATFLNHGINRSGFKVRLSSGTLSGLSTGTDYYAIVIDNNTLAFATSLSNALAGTKISISGTNTAVLTQWEDPNYDTRLQKRQQDAFQGHWHASNGFNGGGAGAAAGRWDNPTTNQQFSDIRVTDARPDGVNGTPRTSYETRPVNVSVGFFIRYAPKGAIKGETLTEIFAGTISGATAATNGVMFFRAPRAMNIQKVVIQLFEKGAASGVLSVDVKKNSTPNNTGMTSILNSTVNINMAAVVDYHTAEGSLSTAKINEGEWLRLDLTSVPASMGDFYVSIYGV